MSNIRGSTNRTTEPNISVAWHETQKLKALAVGLKSNERIAISKAHNEIIFTKYHESFAENLRRKLANFKAYFSNTEANKIRVLSTDLANIKKQSNEIFTLISNSSPRFNKANESTVGAERFKEAISKLASPKLESLATNQIQISTKTEINVPVFSNLQKTEIRTALEALTAKKSNESFLSLSISSAENKKDVARYTNAFLEFLKDQIGSETRTHENSDAIKFASCWKNKVNDAQEKMIMKDFYGDKFDAINLAVTNLLSLKAD